MLDISNYHLQQHAPQKQKQDGLFVCFSDFHLTRSKVFQCKVEMVTWKGRV